MTPAPTSLSIELVQALRGALSDVDAESALSSALSLLRRVGIVDHSQGQGEPWLVLERGDQVLSLFAEGQVPDPLTREVVAALLLGALTRVVESDQHRRVRERMDMLSAASFEGIMVHVDGVIVDANRRLAELLGYEYGELIGAKLIPLCVAPEDIPMVLQRMANRIEGEYVISGIRKDGSRFRAELHGKQGQVGERPVRVVAVRDVTARERAEAQLRESETRLRDLTERVFDLMVISRDGVVIDVGGPIEALLGYERQQVIGRALLDFLAVSSIPVGAQVLAEQREGAYEAMIVNVAGESIPFEIVGVMSTLAGEPVRVAGLRDLREVRRLENERRKLQQQLERSQRLDGLGVLAGGIAHDFNNLLVGVLGNAEFLLGRLTAADDIEAASAIVSAGARAATLTKQMLAYAGQRDLGPAEPINLGNLLSEIRTLLAATLSKKAQLELSLEEEAIVHGNRTTLTQLFMNLLTNASDSLADGVGRIEVSSRRVRAADAVDARWDHALGAAIRPGDWVLVEVRDTGSGMDDATRDRVFEPFFTTKERGHGLGLASCLGIVSAHGGAVLVESELGRGSCFSILLPAARGVDEPATDSVERSVASPCRVLVVDDEPLVRSQLRRSLELRGYDVDEAVDGHHGLAALEVARPDVVILDMVMPDLDGAEVVRRIREAGSRVPIVISSGHVEASMERRLERGAIQGFLQKPYSVRELVDAIERARTVGSGG